MLAEVFEKFRNSGLKNYGLCWSHYLGGRVLSLNAMLNLTKTRTYFISDADICLFFEKGMRGGVSYIFNKYRKANNKYLKFYHPKQDQNILYT